MNCGRCNERPGYIRAYKVDAADKSRGEHVEICEECDRHLTDRRMFTTSTPIACTDMSCGHWAGTLYFTGNEALFLPDDDEPYYCECQDEPTTCPACIGEREADLV